MSSVFDWKAYITTYVVRKTRSVLDRNLIHHSNFLPRSLVDELRWDVDALCQSSLSSSRSGGSSSSPLLFNRVRIGQDNTNELNKDVGVAEMCFIGRNRRELTLISSAGGQNSARDRPGGLYDVIDGLRELLDGILIINAVDDGTAASAPSGSGSKLDKSLDKLLHTYNPPGGVTATIATWYQIRHRYYASTASSCI
jgi:hypothetical protein